MVIGFHKRKLCSQSLAVEVRVRTGRGRWPLSRFIVAVLYVSGGILDGRICMSLYAWLWSMVFEY